MRFHSVKNWSLGLAMVSLVTVGAACAQSLAGVTTTLDKALDSKSATVGAPVTAKLRSEVKADGVTLPKGTELLGKVAAVKADNNGPVSLSLVFTTAKLKDGKEIPVKATVISAYPDTAMDDGNYGGISMAPAPAEVPGDGVYNQQPGALAHVGLSSAVNSSDSATFTSDRNFKLRAGTYLQLGVAPAGTSSSGTNAAE